MALVTSVVPRTRRNVELILLSLAFAVALGAYALVGISAAGRIPADMIIVGGGLVLITLALHVVTRLRAPYADPVILGPPISTEYNEVRPTIDPDERYLLFESNRPGGYGGTDIYIAFKNDDGTWSSPRNLGPTVNTPGVDDTPNISPDGKYWFSSVNGDIYWRQVPTELLDPNALVPDITEDQDGKEK